MEIIEILLPAHVCSLYRVFGARGEGAHVQCGVLEVGLKDRSGHEALEPVLGMVMGPWGAVEGHHHPPDLGVPDLVGSRSGLLQPPTLRELSHCGPESHMGMSLMRCWVGSQQVEVLRYVVLQRRNRLGGAPVLIDNDVDVICVAAT